MITTLSQRLVALIAFMAGPVGVLAPKGITVLVTVVGLLGLAQWAEDGFPRPSGLFPLVGMLAVLALWAATTALWSLDPIRASYLVVRLVGVCIAGTGFLYVMGRLRDEARRSTENAFLIGMMVGFAVLAMGFVYAKVTGASLWGTYFFDPLTTLNNGAVIISLLGWPVFIVLWRRALRQIAFLVSIAAYLGLAFLSSGAALLAPVAGIGVFFVVYFLRKRGALAVATVMAVLVLAGPQVVTTSLFPIRAQEIMSELPASTRHRLVMWGFVAEKIQEKPLWGWGMDASRSINQGERRLARNMEIMPLHPHNAFLQVRLELGLPGAIIAATLVGLFFVTVVGGVGDRFSRAMMAGTGAAYLSVAAVSFGIWQNWWVALAWALAALTGLPLRTSLIDK